MEPTKQVIVIRKDLKMRRGKECCMSAHASNKFIIEALKSGREFTPAEKDWLFEKSFRKICVIVNSEEELLELYEKAKAAGIESQIIQDSGKTEFHGVPTYTALALGPDEESKFEELTGHLKLY